MIYETKEYENGIIGKLIQDEHCDQPYDDDAMVRIVVLHRNYIDPAGGACGRTGDEVMAWAKANAREWFVANLYMYEHSGVAYRAGDSNPFDCMWDSGQVGIVAIKKSEFGKGKGELNANRLQYCKNIAEEYGRWANGECYGYELTNEDGDTVDSCWGYIGFEYAMESMDEAAPYYVAEARDQQAAAMAEEMEEARPDLAGI